MTTSTHGSGDSPFMRFAALVADFGDPFYTEERQRDVWNEASAFGFQLLLWGSYLLCAVTFWFGGRGAVPFGLALLVLTGIASMLTLLYAARLGVDPGSTRKRRPRFVLITALLLVVLAGYLRATGVLNAWGIPDAATSAGMATGAAVVLVPLLLIKRRMRRRQDAEEA